MHGALALSAASWRAMRTAHLHLRLMRLPALELLRLLLMLLLRVLRLLPLRRLWSALPWQVRRVSAAELV